MQDFLRKTFFRPPTHSYLALMMGAFGSGFIGLALINRDHAAFYTILVFGCMNIVTGLAEWLPFNQVRLAALLRILGIGLAILMVVVVSLTLK